jgi:1-acyl-sn-glycerol-3-phosphate acyltransferase
VIRTLWVALVSLVFTFWYGIPILVRARFGGKGLTAPCRTNPRRWAHRIIHAAGVDVTFEGAEHLVPGEGCVLVANHQSWFDVLVLTAYLPVDYRFVAKKELLGIPIFGPAWKACGHISIDRADLPAAIATLHKAGEAMHEDRPALIMFPEGTRSASGELRAFKKGAFVLAIQVGMPVVPAAILGVREVMPKGSWRIRSGSVRVRVGAPIAVEGLTHRDRDALTRLAHGAVARLKEGAPVAGPWKTDESV